MCDKRTVLLVVSVVLCVRHGVSTQRSKRYHPQQNIYEIIASIDERLHHLDHVYSAQLSHILETKLEQCHRKFDALEKKIINLESTITISLDKISENISLKAVKDDAAHASIDKKLDTVFEGLAKKIEVFEGKTDENFGKVQTRVEATLSKVESFEEQQMQRDAEISSDLSDIMFAIDELKSSTSNIEERLMDVANETLLETLNVKEEVSKTEEFLTNDIVNRLNQLDNATKSILNATMEGNELQRTTKTEIKEDFNSYANKVADMNMEIWKIKDALEDSFKHLIGVAINEELPKVFKSLYPILPFYSHGYGGVGSSSSTDIVRILDENFHKILANQHKFLEGCHRVQMDETQIESDINTTLGKLVDMLETILNNGLHDVKNLELLIKKHDETILRNLNQANTNTINLISKVTRNDEVFEHQLKELNHELKNLYSYVEKILSHEKFSHLTETLKNILDNLDKTTQEININNEFKILKQLIEQKNCGSTQTTPTQHNPENNQQNITREMVDNVFNNNPFYKPPENDNNNNNNNNCTDDGTDYSGLIDIRHEKKPCVKNVPQPEPPKVTPPVRCRVYKNGKKSCGNPHRRTHPHVRYPIEVRGGFGSSEEDEYTTEDGSVEETTEVVSETTVETGTTTV